MHTLRYELRIFCALMLLNIYSWSLFRRGGGLIFQRLWYIIIKTQEEPEL